MGTGKDLLYFFGPRPDDGSRVGDRKETPGRVKGHKDPWHVIFVGKSMASPVESTALISRFITQ